MGQPLRMSLPRPLRVNLSKPLRVCLLNHSVRVSQNHTVSFAYGRLDKERENAAALKVLPDLLRELDCLPPRDRLTAIIQARPEISANQVLWNLSLIFRDGCGLDGSVDRQLIDYKVTWLIELQQLVADSIAEWHSRDGLTHGFTSTILQRESVN